MNVKLIEETCCQCGMQRSQWANKDGHRMEGDRFCCEACANETGCRCEEKVRQERLAKKPIKARPAAKPFRGAPAKKA